MDRIQNLHTDHQSSLKLWLKVLKICGINIFGNSLSFLKTAIFILSTILIYLVFPMKSIIKNLSRWIGTHFIINIWILLYNLHAAFEGAVWIAIFESLLVIGHVVWWILDYKAWNLEGNWKMFAIIVPVISTFINTYNTSFSWLRAALAINVSLLFQSLQEDILANVIETQSVDLHESELEEKLKEIIRNHQSTIKIAYELNDVYSVTILLEKCRAAFVIGIHGYFITSYPDLFTTITNIYGLFKILAKIFILHWSGQLVADASEGVARAAYSCQWYTKSRRINKLLHVIMMRSQRPVYLTAWKFSTLTLDNFQLILSEAWSFMSLMTTLSSSKKL